MTRFTALMACPICTRHFEREVTREEVLGPAAALGVKACGRPDCVAPKPSRRVERAKPKKAKANLRETPLVHACLELLAHRGIDAWRQNSGGMKIPGRFNGVRRFKDRYIEFTSEDGISDIVGFIRPVGRVLAVECKIRPRELTADQEKFLAKVNGAGGLGLVVYDDVMELDRQLREAGY